MTDELFSAVSKNLEKHEGRILRMYLDSVGVVTCGIGHAIFAPAAAFSIPFWRSTDMLANREEITAEYWGVKRKLAKPRLMISYDTTEDLLRDDLKRFEVVVNNTFPDAEKYPQSVQVALYDLCFNLGSFSKWPRFRHAVLAGDWATAAAESHRPQVGEERNRDTFVQLNLNT